jgi:hypothetical protein
MSCEILIEFSKNSLFQSLNGHLIENLENFLFPAEVLDFHLSTFTIDKSVDRNGTDRNQIDNSEFTIVVYHHMLGDEIIFT